MNNKLMMILAFALGGGVGFFVAKKLYEEYYEKLSQEDIEDVVAYYKEKYEGNGKEYKKLADKYVKPDLHELAVRKNNNEEDFDSEEIYYENEEEEELAEMDRIEAEEITEEDEYEESEEPHVIGYNLFARESDIYSKVDLYYYRFDDVMCDGNDVVIENPEDILGWEFFKELETKTTAFVRNGKLKIDYEIIALSKSYSSEVANRLETDKERKFRQLARKKKASDDYEPEEDTPKKTVVKKPARKKYNTIEDIPEEYME